MLTPGCFYRAEPRPPDAWGTTVCATEDFLDIGGYDEVIQGWGREDEDFYARLVMAGVRSAGFPGEMIQAVTHSDTERVAHYDLKDRWLSSSINHVYCRAKIDLMLLLQAPLSLDIRRQLYAEVHHLVTSSHQNGRPMTLTLPLLPHQTRICGPMEAKLVYTLPKPGGEGRPTITASSFVPNPARFRQREP